MANLQENIDKAKETFQEHITIESTVNSGKIMLGDKQFFAIEGENSDVVLSAVLNALVSGFEIGKITGSLETMGRIIEENEKHGKE